MPSSRELVIEYLWSRTQKAFERGDMQEAQDCERFHSVLEGMSDAQYEATYKDNTTVEAA